MGWEPALPPAKCFEGVCLCQFELHRDLRPQAAGAQYLPSSYDFGIGSVKQDLTRDHRPTSCFPGTHTGRFKCYRLLKGPPNRTFAYLRQRSEKSRSSDLRTSKMLHDARMAGLGKPQCGTNAIHEGRLWAVCVVRRYGREAKFLFQCERFLRRCRKRALQQSSLAVLLHFSATKQKRSVRSEKSVRSELPAAQFQ